MLAVDAHHLPLLAYMRTAACKYRHDEVGLKLRNEDKHIYDMYFKLVVFSGKKIPRTTKGSEGTSSSMRQ